MHTDSGKRCFLSQELCLIAQELNQGVRVLSFIIVEGDPFSLSQGKRLNRKLSSYLLQGGERCAKEHKAGTSSIDN